MQQWGLIPGLIIFFITYIINNFTSLYLLKAKNMTGLTAYYDIAVFCFRRFGEPILIAMIIINNIGKYNYFLKNNLKKYL